MSNKIAFSDLSRRMRSAFGDNSELFEEYKDLSFDLANHVDIYDDEGNLVPKREAEDKLRDIQMRMFGLGKDSTRRDRKRAFRKYGEEWFEVQEEVIDLKVETGFKESEFFNEFVDMRNIKQGDSQEFWTDDNVVLSVTRVSGDHHDFSLQRLGSGESYAIPTSVYGIAVGADIDLYLAGRLDWSKLTDQCAAAFVRKVQNDMYAEVMKAGDKLPSQFKQTGALSVSTKEQFDTLLEDVSIANGNVPVYVLGTKAALKQVTKLADVDWVSRDQKQQVADTGRLGYYEGTTLMEIPQRFAVNDTTKKLVDSTKLLVMPQVEDKFVKFVDSGETEIYEVTEIGARMDDTMKYEVQRAMGIGTQIGRYFGVWTLTI